MKTDILTIMWKERKGLFRVQGRRSQALLTMLSPVFLAIYMPWSMGPDWVESGMSIALSVIVPFILVGITVPDSFAGERERHTLPTLLASRLPDRAILFGKLATAVIFGWGAMLMVLVLSLVTVNVAHWSGQLLFYDPTILIADLGISFLVAVLTAGLGVLFSLRSSTVQQAQQTLMAVLLLPAMLLQLGGAMLLGSDSGRARLREVLSTLSLEQVVLIVAAVLIVADVAALMAAMARFKRARLILG
jgi:ABC-2 type transport system permease protein